MYTFKTVIKNKRALNYMLYNLAINIILKYKPRVNLKIIDLFVQNINNIKSYVYIQYTSTMH